MNQKPQALNQALLSRLDGRRRLLIVILSVAVLLLLARAVQLQVVDRDFYVNQGDVRQQRTVTISAHRGGIVDRNNEVLAVSTPMSAIWVNPHYFKPSEQEWAQLAQQLDEPVSSLKARLRRLSDKEFVYLKRQMPPHDAKSVVALGVKGVMHRREYRRYYPMGEVAGHVLGFTNIDDQGQEGLELAFNDWLQGAVGKKLIMRDRLNRPFEDVQLIRPAEEGRPLVVSMDKRIQFLAYRALKSAIARHQAVSGSVVVLDAQTSEILAMVNQPGFNPNNRKGLTGALYRNRAVTDVFEPGSTMKPFTVSAGLMSGRLKVNSRINTSPGKIKIGAHWVRDARNNGVLTPAGVIKQSSNVGASQIATSMDKQFYRTMLSQFGFGRVLGSGLPGEASGYLPMSHQLSDFEQATLSYGYGLSVNALQLAQAYSVIANDGMFKPVSFVKGGTDAPSTRVLSQTVARQVRTMMQAVTTEGGTAPKAGIAGYTVAGKTGTAHKASAAGGYEKERYVSLFAGMVPAKQPRLLAVVVVNDPKQQYYGGQVAAPVFSEVMSDALRLFNVAPDNLKNNTLLTVRKPNVQGQHAVVSTVQAGGRT